MIIYIGADHRGFKLKESLKNMLKESGYVVSDMGNEKYDETDDYPDFAGAVAKKISDTVLTDPNGARGIVICGSGVGVDVVANKFRGVRSVLALSPDHALASRVDDDTNVLSIAADYIDERTAKQILVAWMQANFSKEDRHKRRLAKIKQVEDGWDKPF